MKRIKLTKEGEQKLREELKDKELKLHELGRYKAAAALNEGDTWHDNFAFEQTEIQERGLIVAINNLRKQIDTAEIIESTEDEGLVNVGSKVTALLMFSEDDEEEISFTLQSVGDTGSDHVSINSPLGECIFKKEVGFIGEYKVNDNIIKVKILSIT